MCPPPDPPPSDDRPDPRLTHLGTDAEGRTRARMVDVGDKQATVRTATARARLCFSAGQLDRVLAAGGPKGPVEEVARVAGVLAAKRTPELVPMCHGLALDHVEVVFERVDADRLEVRCSTRCTGPTGVEMEAMTGASVAALTVYDMVKGLDKGIRIEAVELLEKSGGRSGHWRRSEADPA